VRDHQCAIATVENLFIGDNLADPFESERVDDIECVVEQDFLPTAQFVDLD